MFQFLVSLAVRNSKTNSFPLALCSITADCTYTLLSLVIPATACILGFSGNTVPPSFCYKCFFFFFHEFSFISFYSILVWNLGKFKTRLPYPNHLVLISVISFYLWGFCLLFFFFKSPLFLKKILKYHIEQSKQIIIILLNEFSESEIVFVHHTTTIIQLVFFYVWVFSPLVLFGVYAVWVKFAFSLMNTIPLYVYSIPLQ